MESIRENAFLPVNVVPAARRFRHVLTVFVFSPDGHHRRSRPCRDDISRHIRFRHGQYSVFTGADCLAFCNGITVCRRRRPEIDVSHPGENGPVDARYPVRVADRLEFKVICRPFRQRDAGQIGHRDVFRTERQSERIRRLKQRILSEQHLVANHCPANVPLLVPDG